MFHIKTFLVLTTLAIAGTLSAQSLETSLGAGIDTTGNIANRKMFHLWKDYLASDPHQINRDNISWNEDERKKYGSYDFLRSEGFLQPSLYGLQPKNVVLYIKEMGSYHVINSLFYWPGDNETIVPLAVTNVVAKQEKGEFRLFNHLPFYTKNWNTVKVGNITYTYYPEYPFDKRAAEEADKFLGKLSMIFSLEKKDLTYYIARNCDDIHRLKGFDYIISMGRTPNVCGFFDSHNNIVYSNSRAGEFYKHELIHIINNKYPDAHPILLSGISAYTPDENSHLGKPLLYHIKRVNAHIINNKTTDLTDFELRLDEKTEPYYIIGALLVHYVLQKDGIEGLKLALAQITNDDEMFAYFENRYKLTKAKLNEHLKKQLQKFNRENKIDFLLDL